MKSISVQSLYKAFKIGKENIAVLKDLTFSVNKGEFLSIMGPSGCGKSTLLYLLGGLDKPTSGQVIVNDKNLGTLKEKEKSLMRKREIGFVFQFYNLVPNLTVEDNIMLPLILDGKKIKDYKSKLDKLLEVTEMAHKRKVTPRELSGGQQQRVAIARALIFEPEIILLDEPIGNLDSKSGNDIMKLFKSINKDFGKTLIQVTHSKDAAQYGTNLLQLKDGEIVSQKAII
ncbi:ABC transporter ATP-binding protein [Serpentinicella sp. ANB-PHB4]|uniref:ABC transporter ATP-binding protein n=1 Tax=Serpentinicella sp. ANB-PHB4 TaxID=3074076 RepID=UPI00285F0B10|nr:ABC transporter ATP-binding protein [Serpentinicella sp. ANB-PHB4]MDR5658500.1 ABC transporter ATP-binding protein [Serpentinicella sp. ANB-PHB4]